MTNVAPILLESMDDFLDFADPAPTARHEAREFPRFFYHTCAEAVIHPPEHVPKKTSRSFVFTRDLSRSGVSIIHVAQLVRGQRIDLNFDGKPPLSAVVSWCQRLPDRYFAVGCRFIAGESPKASEGSSVTASPCC